MSAGWAKLHNDLWSSRKWMSISLAAQGLWTTAVAYSNTMRTYGKLEGHLLPLFRGTPELAAELVDAGLWDVDGDGWQIHDWQRIGVNRPPIDPEDRSAIYERDGYACLACGCGDRLSVDHVVPLFIGGDHDRSNFQTLCRPCNSAKGVRVIDYREVVPNE